MIRLAILALLLAAGFNSPAAAQETCPPAGRRFISDNVMQRVEVISTGDRDPLLGCKFRPADGGKDMYFRYLGSLTPVEQVKREPVPNLTTPPPAGVYVCDAPINIGGMIMGSPQTGLMFGLYDARRYRDFDGGTGAYQFDGASAELRMTSGPLKGQRYRRTGDTLFKPLNDRGEEGGIRCLHSPGKSMQGRW